jgi:23S rRNA maturation mini-RNase III
MKTADDYRKHAHECRMLARQCKKNEERDQLLLMAKTWSSLAEEWEEAQVKRARNAAHESEKVLH